MTAPSTVPAQARGLECLKLKVEQNWTWQRIADHVGYGSDSAAYEAAMSCLRRERLPTVEAYRDIELKRLDAMWDGIFPLATNNVEVALQYTGKGKDKQPLLDDEGNHVAHVIPARTMFDAIDRCARISESRRKILGLDHSDGIAERQTQLQEAQTLLILQLVQGFIEDPEVALTPDQKAKALRLTADKMRAMAIDTTAETVE